MTYQPIKPATMRKQSAFPFLFPSSVRSTLAQTCYSEPYLKIIISQSSANFTTSQSNCRIWIPHQVLMLPPQNKDCCSCQSFSNTAPQFIYNGQTPNQTGKSPLILLRDKDSTARTTSAFHRQAGDGEEEEASSTQQKCWRCPYPWQGGVDQMRVKGPSNPNHSVVPWSMESKACMLG